MNDFVLPCALRDALDGIGPGAVLKRLSDGRRAMVVDYFEEKPLQGELVVCMPKKWAVDVDNERKISENSYKLCTLKDSNDWIVLTLGGEESLIE